MHIQKIFIDSAFPDCCIKDLIVLISSEFGPVSLFTYERKMSEYTL